MLLLVTIPTHLRVLMDVADLLDSSGQFKPVLIYCPSAVFDQNHADCQEAHHDAFIWTGNRFVPKIVYLTGDFGSTASVHYGPVQWLPKWMPRAWLPRKGIYRGLRKKFPFLPSPTTLTNLVRWPASIIGAVLRLIIGTYQLMQAVLLDAIQYVRLPIIQDEYSQAFVNRGRLQRFLLSAFAMEWTLLSRHDDAHRFGFRQRLVRYFSEGLFSGLGDQKAFYLGISELITSNSPALVVLPEENLFYNSQFAVRAAHLRKIPVAIVPFTIVNTLEWAESFFDVANYQVSTGWNRVFARAFPHWVLRHRGRNLILPPAYILGCEYFDMVPEVPWLINSGNADVIAAESQFMFDYYRRAGIRREKIVLTGALTDDKLHSLLLERDSHRKALSDQYEILIREKIILIGLPPDQFGAGKRKGCEFDHYAEMIRYMVETAVLAGESDATVIINLHPRVKHDAVSWLNLLGATIIQEPIERLVPLADVYVAVASATIRLGISCGIPVINYDAYQYDYDDYKGLAGVCEVKSKHDYETVLESLIHDELYYSKIHAAQKATASNLCLVDGKAGERLLNLFDQLTTADAVA